MKALADTIVYGCIFISLCTVALCMETNMLLHLPLNGFYFYLFVFCATLLQYNSHYYIKRSANTGSLRFAWSQQHKRLHRTFMMIGTIGVIISLNFLKVGHFIALGIIGIISALYSFPLLPFRNRKRIKDFGLLKILVLSYVWTLITVWLPIVHITAISPLFMLVFAQRFFFVFVLCLAFDIRDITTDARENIHTLPVMIGRRNCYLLSYLCLVVLAGLAVWQFRLQPDFMLLNGILLSAIATYFMIEYTRRHHTDMVYLAGIDGMMMLQAILVAVSTI